MYKDLSLKERAKVLLYGGKLGLTSVEDIAKLYDDAVKEHLKLGNTSSSYISNGYNPEYEGAQIYADNRNWWERNIASPVNTYFNNISQRAPEFVSALLMFTPVGLVTDLANGNTESVMSNIGAFNIGKDPELVKQLLRKYNKDKFVNYLERKTGKIIKRVPIKDSKIGDVYSEGFSYVDDKGKEIAHIAGNKSRGNNVFVESSYISPEFRNQGIGKQMYFDFNQNVYNNFGTTLHSSPYQHQATVEVEPGSGVFISPSSKLWRGLKLKGMAEIGGLGLDKYFIMSEPLKLKPMIEYKKGGPIVSLYGQWKYPGRDTIIPSNNITMANVNYPVLGISNAGDAKIMMPWNDYKFRGSMVYEHPLIDNQFQLGGNTKPTFDLWYTTVPKQKNDTSSYDLRRAYNMLPFDEMEKFRTIDDYHLPSVAYDEKTDTYTFLKRNGHPTLNYELDWYNSGNPDALEFRERYKLDTLNQPWRYIPRTYLKGGKALNYLNVPEYNIALYNTVSPLGDFPNFWGALTYRRQVKDKLKNGNIYERDYKVGDTQGEKTAMAAWAKRLGLPYDEQDLPVYNGDTVTLPYSLVLEIPYDTNVLKNRILLNKALLDKYSKYRYSDVVDAAIKADLYNLDKLRETYKTGKPVGLTEFGWNSRQLVNNGEILPIENIQSPLNVLGNYNVRYSPEERRLYYSDEYDFNQFENFVPGEPFRIRGYIDLDNKALGGNLFKKGGSGIHIKPENKGKFTRLKKRTGHSASWFKAHGTPAQKKMAVFELNARHWNHKHDEGGYLYSEGGFLLAPYLYNE